MDNQEFYNKLNEIWAYDKSSIAQLYVEGFNNKQEQIYSFLRSTVRYLKCFFPDDNVEKQKLSNLKILENLISKSNEECEGSSIESILSENISKLNPRLRTDLHIFLWIKNKKKEDIIQAVDEVDFLFDLLRRVECKSWSLKLIFILLSITRNIGLKNECSIQLRNKIFKYIECPIGSTFEETQLVKILINEKDLKQKERCITLLEKWTNDKRLYNSRFCTCWFEMIIDIKEKGNKKGLTKSNLDDYYNRLALRCIEEILSPNHEGCSSILFEKALNNHKKAKSDSSVIKKIKEDFLRNQKDEFYSVPIFKTSYPINNFGLLINAEKVKNLDFKSSVDYVLDSFSCVTLDNVEEYKNYVRENSSFLSNILYYYEHDNSVKIKQVSSVQANDAGFDFFVFTELVTFLSPSISSCWDIVKDKITEDSNFDWIFHKNPLLDEIHQDYLNSCFLNLFKKEKYSSISAFYSILPFIEKIVRDLAKASGASVINDDGSSFLTLGNLLDEKSFVDCIDPSVLLNLMGLLTHDKGFHIRNSRLHGNNTNIEELTIDEKYLSLFLLKFFKDINLTQL